MMDDLRSEIKSSQLEMKTSLEHQMQTVQKDMELQLQTSRLVWYINQRGKQQFN